MRSSVLSILTIAALFVTITSAQAQDLPGHIKFVPGPELEEDFPLQEVVAVLPLPTAEPTHTTLSQVRVKVIPPDTTPQSGVYRAVVFLGDTLTCPETLDLSGGDQGVALTLVNKTFFDSSVEGDVYLDLPAGDKFAVGNYLVDSNIWRLQNDSCTALYITTLEGGGRVTGFRPKFDPVLPPITRRP